MIFKHIFLYSLVLLLLGSCIKDDFIADEVEPELRIVSSLDTLAINTSFQLEVKFFDNVGLEQMALTEWTSSDSTIIAVGSSGLITAQAEGEAIITVEVEYESQTYQDVISVIVGASTVIQVQSFQGEITTTSSYVLEGSFEISMQENAMLVDFSEDYRASSSLPGLYLYLSNNRNSISGAKEIGMVTVYNGAHSYEIDEVEVGEYKYLLYFCKPFNIKVGDGEIDF